MSFALGVVPIVLLLLGFPIFLVLLTAVTVALVFFMNVPLAALHQNLFGSVNAYALLAIPYFIYAGELMGRGSVAQRLVDFVQGGVGTLRGSLGVTTVGTATIFGAISGVSAAAVATIGKVMYPSMVQAGYPKSFAAGLITAVGAIDIIIPPSIPMIVYGAAAQESVPRLYAAGIIPGLLIAAHARRLRDVACPPREFRHRRSRSTAGTFCARRFAGSGRSARRSSFSAAFMAACSRRPRPRRSPASTPSLVTRFVFRELSWRDILEAAAATTRFTAQILIIVACAGVFSWLLTVNQVPAALVNWLQALGVGQWTFLLMVNVLLLLVGCFLDPLSAILLLTPLLIPVVKALGIDTVHFGIVVMVNLAIGLFHPPFGINIFVAQSVLGIDLKTIYRGILPFVIAVPDRAGTDHLYPCHFAGGRLGAAQLTGSRPRGSR